MAGVGKCPDAAIGNPAIMRPEKFRFCRSLMPQGLQQFRSSERLPAEELQKVTAEDIWRAFEVLADDPNNHSFGPSVDFDVIAPNGDRLPPKAVFGLAGSEALGFPVEPKHFSGGVGTVC